MGKGGGKGGKPSTVELRQPGLVKKEILSTSFSFYDAEEARRISVKRISNPVLFDALNNPVQDGLYDPALGPIDKKGSCATCRLSAMHCPGHFGHIELAVPVYNPLTFGTVVRLLRGMCLHCHRFKMGADRVAAYSRKMQLIRAGDLNAAAEISTVGVSKQVREAIAELEEDGLGRDVADVDTTAVSRVLPVAHQGRRQDRIAWTTNSMVESRDLIRNFLASVPAKCENCGCCSPKVTPEGANKIYRQALTNKQREANASLGIDLDGELAELALGDDEQEDGRELAGQAVDPDPDAGKKKRRRNKSSDDDGSGSDDSSDSSDSDSDSDSDGSDEKKSEKKKVRVDNATQQAGKQVFITPIEARALLKRLWAREYDFCSMVWAAAPPTHGLTKGAKDPIVNRSDPARFFMQTVLVTPCKLRPPSRMGDMMFEHPQNTHLNAIIQANLTLAELFRKPPTVPEPPEVRAQRAVRAWLTLQSGVNKLIDSSREGGEAGGPGIRQQLEKKQGLFRMNMMGKRVNYAARSVIMPDPYLRTSEIGVPPVFAKKLTFPEHVTEHNVDLMRKLVENGPEIHPGANAIEDERGRVIHLDRFTAEKRAAIAKTLLAAPAPVSGSAAAAAAGIKTEGAPRDGDDGDEVRAAAATAAAAAGERSRPLAKKVYRHLRDGDVLLVNRQPTLHKPGIMAHTAKVLPGQRTIRMHYANCKTYNADFDGDEMNLHFPQDHLARAEAYEIVRADQQYTVPTDGSPLRGLIQDHVVAGVLLTKRDTFLNREEMQQALYSALVDYADEDRGGGSARGHSITVPPPAIVHPRELWTGKQVISAVLDHITHGRPDMTMSHGCKVPANYWGGENSGEGEFILRKNYVCCGIVDKNTFGNKGLVHAVAELHGRVLAGDLLSVLSRLLTVWLQKWGMTCGLDDLILTPQAEVGRAEELAKAAAACRSAAATFAEADENVPDAALRQQIAARLAEREGAEAILDMRSSGALNKITSAAVTKCLPHGTKKPFPKNCLSLMTQSGAKGSMVNFSQIAACLGQQELEGRRVPRMISGKTLPCFQPFDLSQRAGGYIEDRFFSGLRPQEYFFHCMAGREGLVDTAVKTARSGYLQRCMIKNLETLRVHYDHTVRDCDGSVVQFQYGEDGSDVTKSSYARDFQFLADNAELVKANLREADAGRAEGKFAEFSYDPPGSRRALPSIAERPQGSTLGTIPEKLGDTLDEFMDGKGKGYFAGEDDAAKKSGKRGASRADLKSVKGVVERKPPERKQSLVAQAGVTREEFRRLINYRYLHQLAAPGEAVGCIAGQSVGEPSTQMTLNTFHFAGRGEANVTLGIPRLRELLMAAAKKLATPVMTLPLLPHARTMEQAENLARRLRRVRLAELARKLSVTENPCGVSHSGTGVLARTYTVSMQLRGPKTGEDEDDDDDASADVMDGEGLSDDDGEDDEDDDDGKVSFAQMAKSFKRDFAKRLYGRIKLELRRAGANAGRIEVSKAERADRGATAPAGGDDDNDAERAVKSKKDDKEDGEDASDEEDEEDEEGAKTEDRKDARGDDGEGFTDADAKEKKEKLAHVKTVKTEGEVKAAEDGDSDAMDEESDSESDSDSDSDSDSGSGSGSGSEDDDGDDAARAREEPKKRPKAPSRSVGGDLLESLEDIVETVTVDRATRTCVLRLSVRLTAPALLVLELCEKVASETIVRSVPGIDKTYVVGKLPEDDPGGKDPLRIQTDGVNFAAAWANDDLVDCTKLTTNDVYAVLQTYGVEAARQTLVQEVRNVFGVYGIGVDARHLTLIADFMMQQGNYRPCSRAGIETSPSPFLKMSYETAAAFLVDATMKGSEDTLESPSSRIVMGRVPDLGTGSFGLRYDMNKAAKIQEECRKEARG